ncbi:hypothetical protein TcCL_Unassigned04335 [Trypanosoma cruzi]|nr:hypothetical protein TcCL_Unassigned04335 [Trypanosoma cruzi]
MHHGNPSYKRKECNLHALWKISAVCMAKECRDAAFHIAFAIHVSLEARSHHSSVPLPVLLVSLHWRKLSPHIPITVHCGIQINHTAWVRCHPANKSQETPHCLVWHGRQYHYACKRLFFQTRTRLHHTPVKTFGPSHAKEWSEGTAGKATPAAMSSPHTPTHRCPAYHQKQR